MSFDTSNITAGNFIATTAVQAPAIGVDELTVNTLANIPAIYGDGFGVTTVNSSLALNQPLDFNSQPLTNVLTIDLKNGSGSQGQVLGLNSALEATWLDNTVSQQSLSGVLTVGNDAGAQGITNLQSLSVTSGAGTAGQVLALDSSLNLIWKDDYNTQQGLESVLLVSNDANNQGITNLQSLTVSSGVGTSGQVLGLNSSLDLAWVNQPSVPSLQEVLASGNDANQQNITNVDAVVAKSLTLSTFTPPGEDGNNWQFYSDPATLELQLSNTNGGDFRLTNSRIQSDSSITVTRIVTSTNLTPYDFWVSPLGSNVEANISPSFNNPFQTINYAVQYCNNLTASDGYYRYVHVLAGTYNENVTISNKVFIQGEAQSSLSAGVGCSINGSVQVNLTSGGSDMFNNQVTLSGLLINGDVTNISSANAVLCLENCYIYSPNDTVGRGLYHNPSSTDSRLRLWNCQIISGGASGTYPLMDVNSKGSVSMQYCNLSAKGIQNVLRFNGTATCDNINNCKFENSNSATLSALPIVEITADVSGTYTFVNCGFAYSSNSNKSANPNVSGIHNQNASGNNTIISLYNSFFLQGTSTSANYAIQDFNQATATQMVCLYYMNNALPNTAYQIHGTLNVNKFQMQIVS